MSSFSLDVTLLLAALLAQRNADRLSGARDRPAGAAQPSDTLPPLDGRICEIDDKDELAEADFSKVENNLKKVQKASGSPVQALRSQIAAILSNTLPVALYLASAMMTATSAGTFVIQLDSEVLTAEEDVWNRSNIRPDNIWKSCDLAANFILVVASSKTSAEQATKFLSISQSGPITLSLVRNLPASSFRSAFDIAKAAAQKQKKTTVISIVLADVHMMQLTSRGQSEGHISFAHKFVVAIGPEGFVVWQAWGVGTGYGYRFDEWTDRDGDRVRTWDEAEQFVKDFEKLTDTTGPWNAKRNKLYKKLFEIDLNWTCGPQGPEPRCLVPKFEAWVQLEVLEDVKIEDIFKFKFETKREAHSLVRR